MIFSPSNSRWQTVIADLSLILFLVAASALETTPEKEEPAPAPIEEATDISLTLWSDVEGAPSLVQWLDEQAQDDSQRLFISVTYKPGSLTPALERLQVLRAQSGSSGADARIEIVEGNVDSIQVQLVQDNQQNPIGPKIAS